MLILLKVIHGLNDEVPRTLDEPLFFAIVMLIDKYYVRKAMAIIADMWFNDLWGGRTLSKPDLIDWIFISWVLAKATEFQILTKLAVWRCGPKFEDNGLPLPTSVASK